MDSRFQEADPADPSNHKHVEHPSVNLEISSRYKGQGHGCNDQQQPKRFNREVGVRIENSDDDEANAVVDDRQNQQKANARVHFGIGVVIDENKRRLNAFGDKLTPGKMGEWHHAASIPVTVWEQWMKQTGGAIEKDKKLLARYLNDPDNKFFKVSPTNI